MNPHAQRIADIFRQKFSGEPMLYFSPGRINLIGEHVDYNDGFVMPAAIDKGIYFAIAENESDEINFYAADVQQTSQRFKTSQVLQTWEVSQKTSQALRTWEVSQKTSQVLQTWEVYVLSVLNEFELLGIQLKGFNCAFGGNIPMGSGLSSSAALEGGLALAINEMTGANLDRIPLATLCQRAEHNFPNVQCGIMDQFANMLGKKEEVILLDCQSLHHVYLPLHLDEYKIVLLNSKVHHSLAGSEYNVRRQQCEEGLKILAADGRIKSFRDISNADELLPFKNIMAEKTYNRCKYVVEEIDRTERASRYLQQNNLVEFGKLMFQTHEGLSKLYEVSCSELDLLVKIASENKHVIGARLMGGGFGGCTINIVKVNEAENFVAEAKKIYRNQFNIELEEYFVETSDGASRI